MGDRVIKLVFIGVDMDNEEAGLESTSGPTSKTLTLFMGEREQKS